jgi:uracil-DNA glycosylase
MGDNLYSLTSASNYKYNTWGESFPNNKVDLKKLYIHSDWEDFFDTVKKDKRFQTLEDFLSKCLDVTDNKVKIYPYPDLVFAAFNSTPLKQLKVVIIGQDPYHNSELVNNKLVPQAMGMSFSVPVGIKIPSSLKNIYKNLKEYNHVAKIPTHGNLESWTYQGVFMINTALTVQHGYPNSQAKYWTWMTDLLIKYISDNTFNTVFLLWGRPAYNKVKFIDKQRHKVITSSHPSGLSYAKPMGEHSAFKDQDHFKLVNKYLKSKNKGIIVWDI